MSSTPSLDSDSASTPSRRILFRGRKVDLALQQVTLNDGSAAEREVVLHRGAVVLLPLFDDGRVCLIKNERYAVGETLLELPAGTIDPGEPPEITAARELEEETGYAAGSVEKIREWYVSPGVMNEVMHLFVCRDLKPGRADHQPDEKLETVIVAWDDALRMVREGEIEDAKTMLGILLWDRMRGQWV